MLSDLLSLESCFGKFESVMFVDDIQNTYGEYSVEQAIEAGYLEWRIICIGPDCGRQLCWLSDKGRAAALH
ncbi:MAG: hypothetical protein ACRBCK_11965 [Alphaproteobacteria bacterium]